MFYMISKFSINFFLFSSLIVTSFSIFFSPYFLLLFYFYKISHFFDKFKYYFIFFYVFCFYTKKQSVVLYTLCIILLIYFSYWNSILSCFFSSKIKTWCYCIFIFIAILSWIIFFNCL